MHIWRIFSQYVHVHPMEKRPPVIPRCNWNLRHCFIRGQSCIVNLLSFYELFSFFPDNLIMLVDSWMRLLSGEKNWIVMYNKSRTDLHAMYSSTPKPVSQSYECVDSGSGSCAQITFQAFKLVSVSQMWFNNFNNDLISVRAFKDIHSGWMWQSNVIKALVCTSLCAE